MSLNIRTPDPNQAKVFDVADPNRHGKIVNAGAEVSEVRFDDGAERNVPNDHLRNVGATDRLDSPTENTKSEATIIQNAQGAWNRLRIGLTWHDWTTVGAAHVIGRATAMRDAHTNKPEGRGYNAAFAAWARKYGFDLDKGDRARLFQVMGHLAEIEAWLAQRSPTERLQLNHPSTVWRRWKAATAQPKPDAEPKPSPMQKLKDELIAVIEERDRYKAAVERGGGDLWCKTDRVKDITKVMIDQLGKPKAERVAREILKAVKNND
jgi:hypothetical protein